jgi:hypothetical protein
MLGAQPLMDLELLLRSVLFTRVHVGLAQPVASIGQIRIVFRAFPYSGMDSAYFGSE